MNVLIISTNRNANPMPVMPIGACMVAEAAERARHSVYFLDLMFTGNPHSSIASAVARTCPDVVAFSVRNIDNNDMHDTLFFLDDLRLMINIVRDLSTAPIVLGGAALGVMPEEILRLTGADCAVRGPGAQQFPELLDRLVSRRTLDIVPGIAYFNGEDFRAAAVAVSRSQFPCQVPDYHRWLDVASYQSRMATAPVQTKTGCPHQCVYCTYRMIEGRAYGLAEPGSVVEAVGRLSAAGLRDIEFVDSVFNAPMDHAREVCDALARHRHRARLQSLDLNPAQFDEALVTAMEQAGFVGMGITAESASDAVLEGMRKGFTSCDVHHAAEALRRHDIPCAWIFLLGGPGETEATVKETLRFAEKNVRPRDVAFINMGIRIYPGTELESIARNAGICDAAGRDLLAPRFYVSPDIDSAWMEREVKKLMGHRMNIIDSGSLGMSFLPAMHRIGYRLGLRPPLWKYARMLRIGMKLLGCDQAS